MIYVIDDFYPNPDLIRNAALKLKYNDGYFGGKLNYASSRALNPWANNRVYLFNKWQTQVQRPILNFTLKANGSFNLGYSEKHKSSWIHQDNTIKGEEGQMWAAVIYLTPNPPENSGTCFFKNEQGQLKGQGRGPAYKDSVLDSGSEWKPHLQVENIYNRCILYHGDLYHAPTVSYFGNSKQSGRLTQVGFFYAEL